MCEIINNPAAECITWRRITTSVQGYKVKAQGDSVDMSYAKTNAKLMLCVRKSVVDSMVMSECWLKAEKQRNNGINLAKSSAETTGATSGGPQVAMHSQLPPFPV